MVDHLERHNANVARAMHQLGAESTAAFEGARDTVARFLNAPSRDEVIFTKNASEGLNLVANTMAWPGPLEVGAGDRVVITEMEHHSNIVPWQLLTERKGAELRWFGLTDDGRLDLSDIDELITENTKVVSLVWVSNMLGTINPVAEIARRAHEVGAVVVVDASQAAPHIPVDVQAVDADFLVFTGHKVTGPTGIGVLWGRAGLLDQLPPFLGGGEMIETVTMERSTYAGIPHKFEAGTPPIAEAVGLGAALDYLSEIGLDNIHRHEQAVTGHMLEGLSTLPGVTVLGPVDVTAARGSGVLRGRRRAPPRHRPDPRQPRDRDPGGPPLRQAGAQALRRAELGPRVVVPLHDTGRDRRARRGNLLHPEVLQGRVMDLDSLYQEIILDHYRKPHHAGLREPFEAEVHHVNPTCGDEITLRVHLDGETVTDVSYDAEGCSISQAAASVLTDLVIGQPRRQGVRDPRRVRRADAGPGQGRARRGRARGRHRVRGRREVPGADQVRPALLDGVQGRHRPSRHEGGVMTEQTDLPDVPEASGGVTATATRDDVVEAMKDVVDPELGINVVDLGLVYDVHLDDHSNAVLDMTLTSAACPLTDVIQDQTNTALEGLVGDVTINWVWMPPWGPDKITDDGREQLRALGFNV